MIRTLAAQPASVAPTRASSPARRHPNATFWALFTLLNLLLFLPRYLFNMESETLLPQSLWRDGWWLGLNQLLLWRSNLDPWRLSVELTALVALWAWIPALRRPALRRVVMGIYIFTLIYAAYEAVMASIWFLDANFYREYFLARDGLPFLLGHLQTGWWVYALVLTGFAAAIALLVLLLHLLLASADAPAFGRGSRIVMGFLGTAVVLVTLFFRPWTAQAEMVPSSILFKLQQNVRESFRLRDEVAAYDDRTQLRAYDYSKVNLLRKPDIYLIFIESYGSVLYQRPHFTEAYRALARELTSTLADAGWQSRSSLSISPMWGGGSWMAYSSVLYGTRIDNQPQYLSLFERYQTEQYPTLGRTLQAQGYHYGWVSSIADELSDRQWERHRLFMGADQQLRYRDLNYLGAQYGWGPAPPDQYVLNYANELLQESTDKPLLFVTITQNSHYPWLPLPTLVEDWRTLNLPPAAETNANAEDPTQVAVQEKRTNYLRSIEYQLRMLTDFVLTNGGDNSIFVLMGDHQPPQVSRRDDGWATPVHVIGRDAALVDAFAEYGFGPGLEIDSLQTQLHHEGIYSLLMRVLLQEYGDNVADPPDFLPLGAATDMPTPEPE